MADLHDRLERLARKTEHTPDVEAAWRRGRRRRTAKRASATVVTASLVLLGGALLVDGPSAPGGLQVTAPPGLDGPDIAELDRVDDVIVGVAGTWVADYAAGAILRSGGADIIHLDLAGTDQFCGFVGVDARGPLHRECRAAGDRIVFAGGTALALDSSGDAVWDGEQIWVVRGRSGLVGMRPDGTTTVELELPGIPLALAGRTGSGGSVAVVRADGRARVVVIDREGRLLADEEVPDLQRGAAVAWSGDRTWVLDVAAGRLWSLVDALALEADGLPRGTDGRLVASSACLAVLVDEVLASRDVEDVTHLHGQLPGARQIALERDTILVAGGGSQLVSIGCGGEATDSARTPR